MKSDKFLKLTVTISIHTCFFFLIILQSSVIFPQAFAFNKNPDLILTPDRQFDYANHLFDREDFDRAIDEYKRFMFFYPEDQRIELAMFKMGLAYYQMDDYVKASHTFGKVIEYNGKSDLIYRSYFKISECKFKSNDPQKAIDVLAALLEQSDENRIKDEAYYRCGWLYLEMALWDDAKFYFNKISESGKGRFRVESLLKELEQVQNIDRKNPTTAGLLSIVPGAGYLYCGRPKDAFVSFILNCGLIYAAYESFDKGLNGVGGLITAIEIGFFTGNITGSVNSAHKYNHGETLKFIENLKHSTKIKLSFDPEKDHFLFSLNFAF